ncbi:cation diffusion facilitator family transporter [Actinomadura verrucosospora]|uniref:Cation diffusion facilitator family transporter n=2 Tax=Actinomadura verrucosospora TaxID=46165 RepID=A0A7D3ZVC6_ACTVE|nr:cation diffusion facilitator family transporter [Actinomadura verrucosospora]
MMNLVGAGQSKRIASTDTFGDPVPAGDSWAWGAATLAMTAVIAAMLLLASIDVVRVLRGQGGVVSVTRIPAALSVLPSLLVWCIGGLVAAFAWYFIDDCGTGAAAPCLDRPGATLSALSVICLVLPTLLLALVVRLGQRSAVCAILAPPSIASIYILAIHLAVPHAG